MIGVVSTLVDTLDCITSFNILVPTVICRNDDVPFGKLRPCDSQPAANLDIARWTIVELADRAGMWSEHQLNVILLLITNIYSRSRVHQAKLDLQQARAYYSKFTEIWFLYSLEIRHCLIGPKVNYTEGKHSKCFYKTDTLPVITIDGCTEPCPSCRWTTDSCLTIELCIISRQGQSRSFIWRRATWSELAGVNDSLARHVLPSMDCGRYNLIKNSTWVSYVSLFAPQLKLCQRQDMRILMEKWQTKTFSSN
jgi:hypothetical protein